MYGIRYYISCILHDIGVGELSSNCDFTIISNDLYTIIFSLYTQYIRYYNLIVYIECYFKLFYSGDSGKIYFRRKSNGNIWRAV